MTRLLSAALLVVGALLASLPVRAQISDGVIRIGLLNDMTGVYSHIGGMPHVIAAQMAIDKFGGEALGKPVELIYADMQNKPDIAVVKGREWIENGGVDLIAAGSTSSVGLALQELGRNLETIVIHAGPSTSRLTNEDCSPFGFQWVYDTYAVSVGTASALVERGGKTWFFLQVDYAYGRSMVDDATRVIEDHGGQVLGKVVHPFPSPDFASYLLQAQASGAQVIGLANAGQDLITSVKQSGEFGITQAGQQLAAFVAFIADMRALGPEIAQGLLMTTGFYWDRTETTRAWSADFRDRTGLMPGQTNAGMYSAIHHYLRAVEAAGTDDARAVAAMMKDLPFEDEALGRGTVRIDGRSMNDMFLVEVKSPDAMSGEWDLFEIIDVIPAEKAARPLEESVCPLVTGAVP